MHNLSQLTSPLLVLLVSQLSLLAFAPNPVYLAPTVEADSVLARFLPNANSRTNDLSSWSPRSEQVRQNNTQQNHTDTRTRTSNAELPTDFVRDEDELHYHATPDQSSLSEAADGAAIVPGRVDSVESVVITPVEQILERGDQAENSPTTAASQERQQSAAASEESQSSTEAECLESLDRSSASSQPVTVACGHTFHSDCIELLRQARVSMSGSSRVSCPMCRADIDHTATQASESDQAAEEQAILVFIEVCTGAFHGYRFQPSETVLEVKKLVLALDNIPIQSQVILFNGRVLDDDKTLEHYGVRTRSTLVQRRYIL